MNSSKSFLSPATVAALILFASSTSIVPAMADDRAAFEASEASSARIQETSREQAKIANEAAVEDAARAVKADARLDLDVRLITRTSVLIAGDT